MRELHGQAKRKQAARAAKRTEEMADDRIIAACRQLQTSADLDAVLDADEHLNHNPALKSEVRRRIQRAVPHLRDN